MDLFITKDRSRHQQDVTERFALWLNMRHFGVENSPDRQQNPIIRRFKRSPKKSIFRKRKLLEFDKVGFRELNEV